ncbi:MAG TPA: PQQ-dependent sugar dehydrogenase [Actinophytocola sp.]|uniref:PQQ-dependent sugar dehydrogenase n=1 Tax=Actinophytocola sp. TaxID=1872138 RepID=UPI002E03351F|nr:PQQ-dependent sugar dehydrogenase [Actinophytocola sp.]
MTGTRILAVSAVLIATAGCAGAGGPAAVVPPSVASAITGAPELPAPIVQTIATGLRVPWGLAFLPDGTALVTERGNDVPTFEQPTGRERPVDRSGVPRILSVTPAGRVTEVQRLSEVDTRLGEGGLLGIAVSPGYATDRWVYVYYSSATDNRIARLHLGSPPEPILTGIPVSSDSNGGARFHLGGRLAFGPDGMLYASVGETYFDRNIAQDRDNLGGKILRLTPDGKPAPGNPFPDSPVWTYGHRNVQGLAWDALGRMYASELGDKTYDELNVIQPGRNYGWPAVEGVSTNPDYTNPIATWTPTAIASPSGIAILNDHIYLACLAGQTLYRLDLDGTHPQTLLNHTYGRFRTLATAPDGSLWATTSNRDQGGREDRIPLTPEDDRILRITVQ